jgi:hypothetical protein
MIKFEAEIERFASNGEKTGWTYISFRIQSQNKIKPGERRSIRVKGTLDQTDVSAALMPMGGGDFIMALNKEVRKKLKKDLGTKVSVSLAYDPILKLKCPRIWRFALPMSASYSKTSCPCQNLIRIILSIGSILQKLSKRAPKDW